MDLNEEFVAALAGRYEIIREIGRGGMAIVYLAWDVRHSRNVALKVLSPELTTELGVERFLQEIRITAPFVHPNIVALYDSGEAARSLYYVMPYVEGPTLRQRLKREVQLPLDDVIQLTKQVASALDYAHARGVVHRDIKPDNVLLLRDHVLVTDFGLARAITSSASTPLTSKRFVVGTAEYMSPEQCTPGSEIDGRSDIYSLACVAFEMITGMPPFRGASVNATMTHHLTSEPPSVRRERPRCPIGYDTVLHRALAKVPADRYKSSREFVEALESASLLNLPAPVRGRTKGALEADSFAYGSDPVVRPRAISRRPIMIGAGLLGLLAVMGFMWYWSKSSAVRLGDRDWLLVADFKGPQSDPSLSNTVRELITTELNQSRSFRTVTRQQLNSVMRLASVPETTHVDADLARQLAVRSAVRAIVVGTVDRLAQNRYSVAIHVVDAKDGTNLFSVARSASDSDLVSNVGEAGRDVRRQLGERSKSIARTRPLIEVATPSFPAFEKYIEGLDRVRVGDMSGANASLHQALALDSEFAAAWAAIGTNHLTARQADSARYAFTQALSFPSRLTQAQKYRLQGDMAYLLDHDVPAAVRWYDLHIAEYPMAVGGRSNRALHVSALGRYEDAVTDLKAALDANPFGKEQVQLNLFNLAAMQISRGPKHFKEAEQAIRDLNPPFRLAASATLMVASDQWADAIVLADSIAAQPRVPTFLRLLGMTGKASALVALDSADEGRRVLQAEYSASSGSLARWYDRATLLLDVATRKRPAVPATTRTDTSAAGAMSIALRSAIAGDTASAVALLRRVDSASPRDRAQLGHGPALVRGWIAAHGQRWSEITRTLSAASLAGEHDASVLDRVSSLELRWLVANAYASLGKRDSAVLHMRSAIAPDRIPIGHLVLRGLILPAARQRIASWSSETATH